MRHLLNFISILSIFVQIWFVHSINSTDGPQLRFVQAMWRHGDRAALDGLYPVLEDDWTFGGGGFGELTPDGMQQLHQLGAVLRKRYVTDGQFLGKSYSAKEIYIRSTNVNRTIISAMSMLYGLYPPGVWNTPGLEYPVANDWQLGFNFIPVHVSSDPSPNKCVRRTELIELASQLPEVQKATEKMLALNVRMAGYYNITKSPATFDTYPDTLKCQRNHFNETLYEKLPFYNESLFVETQTTSAPLKRFSQGQFENSSVANGIDIGKEARTLLSGPLINEIADRAGQKMGCASNCTGYLKNLKFYGYSSHDMIIYGVLVTLGVPEVATSLDGWPGYSASLIFEFYSQNGGSFFKVLYRNSPTDELTYITERIPDCNGAELCPLDVLKNIAAFYKPVPDFETLCQTPLP